MKKIVLFASLGLVVALLVFGCERASGPESKIRTQNVQRAEIIDLPEQLSGVTISAVFDGGEPDFIDTLPDNTVVGVYAIDTAGETAIIGITYADKQGLNISRVLQFDESLISLFLYNTDGQPLAGYQFTGNTAEYVDFTAFSGASALGISQSGAGNSPIAIEVMCDGEVTQFEFADEREYDSAMTLYEAVYYQGCDTATLSSAEKILLGYAEAIAAWGGDYPQQTLDMQIASQLILDRDFQSWIDAEYSKDQPVNEMPEILKMICDIVRMVKQICEVIGDRLVCKVVEVVVILCDILARVFA